ncbi:hypothetical protein [Sporosarcina sp. UB5]|uniref:hypothetical protein n=1 Tax=Sporosarcina sp. UB5 TaxID=3047463 RepID=UPI003D78D56F
MFAGWIKRFSLLQTPLISIPIGRFPRARLQPPRHFVPVGSSARAVPAGVADLHSNQLELNSKEKSTYEGVTGSVVGEKIAINKANNRLINIYFNSEMAI